MQVLSRGGGCTYAECVHARKGRRCRARATRRDHPVGLASRVAPVLRQRQSFSRTLLSQLPKAGHPLLLGMSPLNQTLVCITRPRTSPSAQYDLHERLAQVAHVCATGQCGNALHSSSAPISIEICTHTDVNGAHVFSSW